MPRLGRWKPGQSGNPNGRPKGYDEFRATCAKHTKDAVAKLVSLMHSAVDEKVQCQAAQAILDRAWGRPPQAITGEGGEAIKIDSSGQLAEVLRELVEHKA